MRPMRFALFVVLFAVAALVPACKDEDSGLVSGRGTLRQGAAECDSWFLFADSGKHYELTALAPELREAGTRVRYTLRLRPDLASICMAGPIADVVAMAKL